MEFFQKAYAAGNKWAETRRAKLLVFPLAAVGGVALALSISGGPEETPAETNTSATNNHTLALAEHDTTRPKVDLTTTTPTLIIPPTLSPTLGSLPTNQPENKVAEVARANPTQKPASPAKPTIAATPTPVNARIGIVEGARTVFESLISPKPPAVSRETTVIADALRAAAPAVKPASPTVIPPTPTVIAPTATSQAAETKPVAPAVVPSTPNFVKPENQQSKKEFRSLGEYMIHIKPEMDQLEQIIKGRRLFSSTIKDLSPEQVLEDFKIYYPVYKAAEIKYGTPWYLIWIMHVHETTASRHPAPESSGYLGAMQIMREHLNDPSIKTAPSGWEFLRVIPGLRYTPAKGFATVDSDHILYGAAYIRRGANRILDSRRSNISEEQAFLMVVQYNYSAEQYGRQRVAAYRELKPLLQR